MKLLVAQPSTTTGVSFPVGNFGNRLVSHLYTCYIWGTFGVGGTVDLEISPDDVNWFDVANLTAITAKTVVNVEMNAPFVRGVINSGDGATSLNLTLL